MQVSTKFLRKTRASVLCTALSLAAFAGCTPVSDIIYTADESSVEIGCKGCGSTTSNDVYANFAELDAAEPNSYQISVRDIENGNTTESTTLIFAPHGGGIESGSTEIADAIADASTGADYDFYSFTGIKPSNNATLHITSSNFDEPICEDIVEVSTRTIAIHGCATVNSIVYVGGRDATLKAAIALALSNAGFTVSTNPPSYLAGTSVHNICNRNSTGEGVQLEISKGLRLEMMTSLYSASGRASSKTMVFYDFVDAVRSAL